jgi:hypothetical protein
MRINDKILNIPPYISTHWSRVTALHMQGDLLVVTLIDGTIIHIPALSTEVIEQIFNAHATYLEKEHTGFAKEKFLQNKKNLIEESPIRLAFGSLDGLNTVMQHHPDQANAPDLPPEILQKIGTIGKLLIPIGEDVAIPKAELNCNCFYCQIARVLNSSTEEEHSEEVLDTDLQFEQWTITQTGDQLYLVTSRLDEQEKYHVYLGQPVGCTCGKTGCEHILAVLKS